MQGSSFRPVTYLAIALVAGMAASAAPARAAALDDAKVQEMMQIILEQRKMIEAQSATLKSLQDQVEALRDQSSATASAVATQAKQVEQVERRVDEVQTASVAPAAAIPQTDDNYVTGGEPRISLSLSGQVNRMLLGWSDGHNGEVFNVDNDSSGTRFRFIGKGQVTDDLSISSAIEIQPQVNDSNDVNQDNPNTDLTFDLRRAEAIFESKRWGKVWLGKGWAASDSTSEVDLSGTTVVGYASVGDVAGGLFFRENSTGAFGPKVKEVFTDLDGLGRVNRIRYDTPSYMGFNLSGGYVSGGAWDAALRYAGDYGFVKVASAIAYSDGTGVDQQQDKVNGSVSFLHESGLNLTGAAGFAKNSGSGGSRRNDTIFYYVKGGYIAKVFDIGATNFSVDGGQVFDNDADGDTGSNVGIQLVQNLQEYGTQIYVGGRGYTLNRRVGTFDDIWTGMGGARVKF